MVACFLMQKQFALYVHLRGSCKLTNFLVVYLCADSLLLSYKEIII